MNTRYAPIETYDYPTEERSYIRIINIQGDKEFLVLNHNQFDNFSLDLKTGFCYFLGDIRGEIEELKLLKWKQDQSNENLIKKIDILIVKNGYGKRYIFNAGIQHLHEDYKKMRFTVVLKHDYNNTQLIQSVKPLGNDMILKIDIDWDKVSLNNLTPSTTANFFLGGIGFALAIVGIKATVTVVTVVTLAIGASLFVSTTYEFLFELTGNFDDPRRGNMDFFQELFGLIFESVTEKTNEYLGSNLDETAARGYGENLYFVGALLFSILTSTAGFRRLTNLKNYRTLGKRYDNAYIYLKKITTKGNLGQKIEGGTRAFNYGTFGGDIFNSINLGKTGFDKATNDFPELLKYSKPENNKRAE